MTDDVLRCHRERQAWRTGRLSIVSKSAGVGARLITVPLALGILGSERYGLWLTVSSALAWLGVYDLGLSSGLLNTIGQAYGREDRAGVRRLISSALAGFAAMSLVMLGVVVGLSGWAGLPRLVGVAPGSPLAADARSLFLFCGALFAVSFTANSVNNVTAALQEGYLGGYAQISGVVAGAGLLVGLSFRGASILEVVACMSVPPLVASCCMSGYFFLVRHPGLRPALSQFSGKSLRAISACGTPIFVSQLADMAILYTSNLLIANRLGAGLVPSYTVPMTAFMIVGSICYGLVFPYQPAYAEACARGDYGWVRRAAFRALARNLGLIIACGLGMVAVGPVLIRLWTGGRIVAGRGLLLALAVYFAATVWTMTNGILLLGIGRVKTKAALQMCVAAVHIVGAWFLLPQFGVLALPLAGTCGYLIDAACSLPIALRDLRSRSAATEALSVAAIAETK